MIKHEETIIHLVYVVYSIILPQTTQVFRVLVYVSNILKTRSYFLMMAVLILMHLL